MGTHVLTFYYKLGWHLDSQIRGRETSSDQEEDKSPIIVIEPYIRNEFIIGRAKVEIFSDERCTYELGFTSPIGDKYRIIIETFSHDGESVDVKSFYERLVLENLRKKELGSKPRIVVPGGIYNIEKFLVKNKNISFNLATQVF